MTFAGCVFTSKLFEKNYVVKLVSANDFKEVREFL